MNTSNKQLIVTADILPPELCQNLIQTFGEFEPTSEPVQIGSVSKYQLNDSQWSLVEPYISAFRQRYFDTFLPLPYRLQLETNEVLKYSAGSLCQLHIDEEPIRDHDRLKCLIISIIVYLNDDYDGGYLEFPFQNISVKPKAGRATIFPVGYTTPHQVTQVLNNERLILNINYGV